MSAAPASEGGRYKTIIIFMICIVLLASYWSMTAGASTITLQEMINSLFDFEGPRQDYIVLNSRLPRTLLALMTGANMAISGCIIQALLRNALASPDIIGINSAAALAVCIAVLAGISSGWLPIIAVIGGLGAAVLVGAGSLRHRSGPARLALIGVAIGLVFNSAVDFILVTAPPYLFSAPLVWMSGSLWARGWNDILLVAPFLVPLTIVGLLVGFRLDLIRLGDAHAHGLGMNVRVERPLLLLLASTMAAISVAAVGPLGFIGLMAPHIGRQLVGGRHRLLLPVSALTGMIILVVADAAGRAMAPPMEISAGILTALFGAPYFIFILLRQAREEM